MNNKGFLFTILTILIAISIIALASFFATERVKRDLSAEKVNNVFDDVETDIEDILKISASIERSSGYITVSFRDHFPLDNGANTMSEYKSFIEGYYAQEIGSNISISGLSNSTFTIKPYDLTYEYPSYNKEGIWVYNKSGDADAIKKYLVEIDFDKNLANVVNQSIPGDLEVVIDAKFANTEYINSISIARNDTSFWSFNLMGCDCNLSLYFGSNMIGGEIRNSSMVANVTGDMEGDLTTSIVLGEVNESVGVTSSIYVWFKNKLTREDYIWLVK